MGEEGIGVSLEMMKIAAFINPDRCDRRNFCRHLKYCASLRVMPLLRQIALQFLPFKIQEVMLMQESSKCMGLQVEISRLCAGAVL